MVLNDEVPGVQVELRVHGQPLKEHIHYQCSTKDTKIIAVDVVPENGAFFEIDISIDPKNSPFGRDDLMITFELEGEKSSRIHPRVQFKDAERWIRLCYSRLQGLTQSKKYIAGDLQFALASLGKYTKSLREPELTGTVSDDANDDDEMRQLMRKLGKMSVHMHRVRISSHYDHSFQDDKSPLGMDSLPETAIKTLKGKTISHRVQLNQAPQSAPLATQARTYRYEYIDVEPHATYQFTYLSQTMFDAKISEGLSPNASEREQHQETDNFEDLSKEDLLKSLREARAQIDRTKKRTRDGTSDLDLTARGSKARVKRETLSVNPRADGAS
ncbi:MAG: hypothetical protein M1831_003280 [Alyxoria varia]|nr:MAG: hypothetical protein M1831_003280 [Alyxoria varia]